LQQPLTWRAIVPVFIYAPKRKCPGLPAGPRLVVASSGSQSPSRATLQSSLLHMMFRDRPAGAALGQVILPGRRATLQLTVHFSGRQDARPPREAGCPPLLPYSRPAAAIKGRSSFISCPKTSSETC
jgi:hypothetical protein